VDVSHPIRVVVPSLDGPVLEVLAGTTRPMTVFDVHRVGGSGSVNGIRKVLERMTRVGLVTADRRGNATYYAANRDHLAWPAVEALVALGLALRTAIVQEVERLSIAPLHVSLFGSAARRDGDADSDIDLLIIKPDSAADTDQWNDELDRLRASILHVSGNRCQVFDMSLRRLRQHIDAGDPLVAAWLRDGVLLAGSELSEIIEQARNLEVE
jgi:predicted nucleotidyltransferase